jgi:hypothetical protein
MLPRKKFVFRGCILLSSFGLLIVVPLMIIFVGKPTDVLNRVGILLEMIGIFSIIPDLVGEKNLENISNNVAKLSESKKYLRYFLNTTSDDFPYPYPKILAYLMVVGNVIICVLLIFVMVGILATPFQNNWEYIGLLIVFLFLGFEAITWLVLFLLFVTSSDLAQKSPKLFDFFMATNSFISSIGVLISSALAYMLDITSPLLISIANKPIKKTLVTITLPFVITGVLLQFIGTFVN